MRFHFITVPIHDSAAAQGEVNRFLASHRVIAVDRQLVVDGGRSAWALCISYTPGDGTTAAATAVEPGKRRVDYRELLSPSDFQVFARLRELPLPAPPLRAAPARTSLRRGGRPCRSAAAMAA